MVKFKAELREVKQAKKYLDNVYTVKLETYSKEVMDLGKIPPQVVVDVEIKPEQKGGNQ